MGGRLVSTACGSGRVLLLNDPPATAGGTDLLLMRRTQSKTAIDQITKNYFLSRVKDFALMETYALVS